MMVITVHMKDQSWTWLSGALGVTVFFVLSGYLITLLALREEGDAGRLSLGAFYVRRTCRILPPYAVVLALYCVLILGLHAGFSAEKKAPFLRALPYYATYLNEFAPPAPFYQSWSLGIEEKFYLAWPVLGFVLLRRRPALRTAATLVLALAFQCLPRVLKIPVLAHYASIMIGCLLAQLLHDRHAFERLRFLGQRWVSAAVLAGLTALQLSRFRHPEVEFVYPWVVALAVAGTAHGAFLRVLSLRPLVHVGSRSYGIYLVHLICINVAGALFNPRPGSRLGPALSYALVLCLSVAAAEVLFRLVEKPCTEFGRRWSERRRARHRVPVEEPVPAGR